MTKTYRTSRIVQWYDTDAAGIAHFTAVFRWMEEVEHEFLRSLGMSVSATDSDGQISFPRVSVGSDYHSPVKFEDVIEIALSIHRLGEKSVSFEFAVTGGERDVATIRATTVCCRIPPGGVPRAIPIPAHMRQKLREYMTDDAITSDLAKAEEPRP
jgi:4-hydroxybenzoyl-CoA thioesterase/acyl-CoA thioester hydrolase